MTEVIIRIVLRYVAAFLSAKGLLTQESGTAIVSDPNIAQGIEIGLGLFVGMAAECWYWATCRVERPSGIERSRLQQVSIAEPISRKMRKTPPRPKQSKRASDTKKRNARRAAYA